MPTMMQIGALGGGLLGQPLSDVDWQSFLTQLRQFMINGDLLIRVKVAQLPVPPSGSGNAFTQGVAIEGLTWYATDGVPGTDPVTDGGTGTPVWYSNGAWHALAAGPTTGFVTSVSGSGPISSSGGTTPAIGVVPGAANRVLASPDGSFGAVTLRALAPADLGSSPSAGKVLTATSPTTMAWQTPSVSASASRGFALMVGR